MKTRGLYATSTNRLFAIADSTLFEIKPDASKVSRGTLNTTTGNVYFSENETQLMVSDGNDGWVLALVNIYADDGKTVLVPINGWYNIASSQIPGRDGSAYMPGTSLVNIGGFFVQVQNDTPGTRGRAEYSALRDGLSWPGDFITAESSPDELIAVSKINNELLMFGSRSVEFYYLTGDNVNPFAVAPQGHFDIGCAAVKSVATFLNTVFWIGASTAGQGIVWMANSYQPQKISNHGIEAIIASMSIISDAIGWCYQEEGHSFYVLNFPTGNRTLVYDLTTGLWHERCTFANNVNVRWFVDFYAYWNGKNYVAGSNDANIYEMSLNNISQAIEPFAILQCSNDGGYSWGREISMSMGKLGQRLIRYHTHRLGAARDRVFRHIYVDSDLAGFVNRRVRTSPHIHNDRKRIFYDEFEIDFERGIGTLNQPPVILGASMDVAAGDS